MIIIRNDSSTEASAMPSVARVTVPASCEIGAAVEGQDHEHDAAKHDRGDVHQRFDVPLHVEPADQPMQDPGQQKHLERERHARGPPEMRLAGEQGHERRRHEQHQPLRGEQVDQRDHPPLRQHGEGEKQQHRRAG